MNNVKVWFPEPDTEDSSIVRKDEGWFEWSAQATSRKGRAERAFLNTQLAHSPEVWKPRLYKDLRKRPWEKVTSIPPLSRIAEGEDQQHELTCGTNGLMESQAFAILHSRITVTAEISKASAISSTLRPPKKRNSKYSR